MVFGTVLAVAAMQFFAVFLSVWHCWPNVLLGCTVLLLGILSMPAVICLLRKNGHKLSFQRWQRRFLYALFLVAAATDLMYMLYAAGHGIYNPPVFIAVSFTACCLVSDSCYLNYLYRKNRNNQSKA